MARQQTESVPIELLNAKVTNNEISIACLPDINLDYDNVRRDFYEKVQSYYKNNNSYFKFKKWNRELVYQTISNIREGMCNKVDKQNRTLINLRQKYEVTHENGKDILILKRNKIDRSVIQVVPYEEYFEIILDAHKICGHGDHEQMLKLLKPCYYIPPIFIDMLIASCNVCRSVKFNKILKHKTPAESKSTITFNSIVQIGFVKMNKQPDGEFEHILYYIDKMSHYILLRALISRRNEFEVSLELLKIFLDFGPPKKIETHRDSFLKRSISVLNNTWPVWDIAVTQLAGTGENIITPDNISKRMGMWMQVNKSKNWAVGCRMVQMQMNTTIRYPKKNVNSPYYSVFGFDCNYGPFLETESCRFRNKEYTDDSIANEGKSLSNSEDDEEAQCIPLRQEESFSNQTFETNNDIFDNSQDSDCKQSGSLLQQVKQDLLIRCPIICHICNVDIFNCCTCMKCQKSVHSLCCRRFIKYEKKAPVSQTICLKCSDVGGLTHK